MKKLIVIFPGAGYGLDSPLLYYADFLFETKGYERIHMDYQAVLSNRELSSENKIAMVREYVYERVKDIDFNLYDEIVFLSKSIGAVEAGILAEKLGINVIQIFITPVEEAVPYCDANSYIVIGTKDKAYQVYKDYCDTNDIKALFVDEANHSLEVEGKPYQSMDVLKKVMQFIER